jgi:hypothetical protein
LRALRIDGDGRLTDERNFDSDNPGEIVSFNQDNDGEIYVVSLAGPVFRLTG